MNAIEQFFGALEPWIHEYGSVAIFVILTLESFGAPLPGESLLITAAVAAGHGEISIYGLLIAGWAGAVIGDNIGYFLGRWLGHRALVRFGSRFGITSARLRKVEDIFNRYGPVTICFARFVNILRQLNGLVAGMLEMHWLRFLIFNAIGGALWVAFWTTVGYYLGKHGTSILHKLGLLAPIVVVVVVVAATALAVLLHTERWAHIRHAIYARLGALFGRKRIGGE